MTRGSHLPSHSPCKKELALQWGPLPVPPFSQSYNTHFHSFSLISTKQLLFLHLPQPCPNLWTCFYRPGRSQGALNKTDARNNRVDLMSTCSPLSGSPSSLFTKSTHFYCNAHATDVAFVVQGIKCSGSLSALFCTLVLQADTAPSSAAVPGPLASLKSTLHGIYGSVWFVVIFLCKANQVRFLLKPNCSTPKTPTPTQDH